MTESTLSADELPSLEGKVALVTGASRGIGAGVARAFAAAGADVVVAARDEAGLAAIVADVEETGSRGLGVLTDVSDPDAVANLVDRTVETFGRLDIACNNAGGSGHPPTQLAEITVEQFDSGVAVNLRGVFLCLRAEIPAMLASGGGAIVNMSSTAGIDAVAGLATYVASKHGVVGLTKVAALDYAAQGIRVNAIAPGPILTENLASVGEDAVRMSAMAMPMRRVGEVDEVAAAAVWLCSDQASFVTGVTLPVDGGKLAGTPPFQRKP
jgi:NAD(P)-dependent dehydrogenase (short-subunit alcohol dehydrogenase family)